MDAEQAERMYSCDTCGDTHSDGNFYEMINTRTGAHESRVCVPCFDLQRAEEYRKNGRLRTSVWTSALCSDERRPDRYGRTRTPIQQRIIESIERIQQVVRIFDQDVWHGGLETVVNASKRSGMASEERIDSLVGKVKVMTCVTAGRVLITLDSKMHQITLITLEKDQRAKMGIQGIDATEEAAIALLGAVTRKHLEHLDGGIDLKDDDGVSGVVSRPELTDAEAEVLSAAREYGKAVERVMKIHDQGEKVHGLDEFDPKYVSWENRLFYAERARDKARDHLHVASYVLAGGKRKELVGRRKGAKS